MTSGHLNQNERYRIHALRDADYSLRDIAFRIDRTPATICRELQRNSINRHYQPGRAQWLSWSPFRSASTRRAHAC